jgi:hypothetical protein
VRRRRLRCCRRRQSALCSSLDQFPSPLQVSAEPSANSVKKPSRQSIAKPDQAREKIRGLVLNTLLFKGAVPGAGCRCLPGFRPPGLAYACIPHFQLACQHSVAYQLDLCLRPDPVPALSYSCHCQSTPAPDIPRLTQSWMRSSRPASLTRWLSAGWQQER